MNNILAAQVLRSHLPEITDGAYKTATEIAIETLYRDAYEDWKKRYNKELSMKEYLELSQEEWNFLGGDLIPSREKKLREEICEECSQKALTCDKENKYNHNCHICQDFACYDFRGCPDDLECTKDYTFLALCDEVSDFDCKKCWKNFLRGEKC